MKLKAEDLLSMDIAVKAAYRLPPEVYATCVGHGSRHPAMARKLQKMGVKGGVPDWLVIWKGQAVLMELKVAGYPSAQQKECHAALHEAGASTYVVRSVEQFFAILSLMGVPLLPDFRPEGEWNEPLPF